MADIPASIFLDLLRNNILATDEALLMAMFDRWWRLYSIPDMGFIVTSRRIVFYKSGLTGLTKVNEISLAQIADCSFESTGNGQVFSLILKDESKYSSPVRLAADDCHLVGAGLHKLLVD